GVQVAAADRAKAGAVGPAQDLVREGEGDSVPGPRGEIEAGVLEVGRPELFVPVRSRRLVLAVIDGDVESSVAETTHARADEAHVELELEHEPGRKARQRKRSFRRFRDRNVALPAEFQGLELDLLDVAKLLARLQAGRADVEDRHLRP